MEFLARYVVLVVLAICLCVGYIIKHSISSISNKYIPLILGGLGIVLNLWINSWEFTAEILLGGLASGLASTGTHELIRHLLPRQESVNNSDFVSATDKTAKKSNKDKAITS